MLATQFIRKKIQDTLMLNMYSLYTATTKLIKQKLIINNEVLSSNIFILYFLHAEHSNHNFPKWAARLKPIIMCTITVLGKVTDYNQFGMYLPDLGQYTLIFLWNLYLFFSLTSLVYVLIELIPLFFVCAGVTTFNYNG